MSVKAVAWAFEQKVGDPGVKVLLLALADFANEENISWHRRETLAERVECSGRTITRYIQALVDKGLITVEQRRLDNGANSSNCYRLHLEQQSLLLPPGQIGSRLPDREPPCVQAPWTQPVQAPETRCVHTPETHGVQTIEPSSEPSREPVRKTSGVPIPDWMPAAWEEFVADRSERKKRLTSRAVKAAISKLEALREQGEDLAEVINQSIERSWSGLFEVKKDLHRRGPPAQDVAAEAVRLIEQRSGE